MAELLIGAALSVLSGIAVFLLIRTMPRAPVRARGSGEPLKTRLRKGELELFARLLYLLRHLDVRCGRGRLGLGLRCWRGAVSFARKLQAGDGQCGQREIDGADLGRSLSSMELAGVRLLAAMLGGTAFALLMLLLVPDMALPGALLGCLLGWLWPRRLVLGRAEERRASCERELPELMELLALGLSAGLSFDAALELYCERRSTPLSAEFARCQRDYFNAGVGRDEALNALAQRCGGEGMRRLCLLLRQGLRFGAPMERMLLDMAADLREEQKKKVEERVGEAPVKMLLPMALLILPAMLLLVLGPALLQVLEGI